MGKAGVGVVAGELRQRDGNPTSRGRSRARVRLVFPLAIYLRVYRGGHGIFLGPGRAFATSAPLEKSGPLGSPSDRGHRLAGRRPRGGSLNQTLQSAPISGPTLPGHLTGVARRGANTSTW